MFTRESRMKAFGTALALAAMSACGNVEGGESDLEGAVEEYGSAATEASATLPAGTALTLELQTELSTRDSETGDRFTATVLQPIVRDGNTAIPAGSVVTGHVTGVQPASDELPAVLKIDFDRIAAYGEQYPLEASLEAAEVDHESDASTAENAARVGVTTAAGAIIGRVIGGNATGTLVGAAVGAAAGTAIVLSDQDGVAVLAEGAELRILLTEPLTIEIES